MLDVLEAVAALPPETVVLHVVEDDTPTPGTPGGCVPGLLEVT